MSKCLIPKYYRAKRREQFHRRRMFDPDAPIDYINDRNKKFNQKLEKFYGKYTEDIRVCFNSFLSVLRNVIIFEKYWFFY